MTSETEQLMLIADVVDVLRHEPALPPGYAMRPIEAADEEALAAVYRAAYASAHAPDDAASRHELAISYAGEYGVLDPAASPAVFHEGRIVAAVMVVESAPWPGSPPGPFVIEVMTQPAEHRRGLAECAMVAAAHELGGRGATTMALFVMANNAGARALYAKLGFREWAV